MDVETKKEKPFKLEGMVDSAKILRFSPRGDLLAVADGQGNIYLLDVANSKLLQSYANILTSVLEIGFKSDQTAFYAFGNAGELLEFSITP